MGWLQDRAGRALHHIKNNNIRGVVLLSGDLHWSGAFKLSHIAPYNLYEFMPTPVATSRREALWPRDPVAQAQVDATPVYGVFDVNTTVTPATLTVQYYDSNNVRRYGPVTLSETRISPYGRAGAQRPPFSGMHEAGGFHRHTGPGPSPSRAVCH
ncbi:hypothetical protein [Archangium sp.]|uniref:hypothetical protein n=1 Tax=Archangium sp. TaxID=1872627 RepID=UPI002D452EC6|nr:hypothetical protein [Archangium sp.]HYO55307.1 hypothetical protein [Archangium sp.]